MKDKRKRAKPGPVTSHESRVTGHEARSAPLRLAPHLRAIMEQEYPRFWRAEYARRHQALAAVMEKTGVDLLLIVTENRSGNATQWVTGWPGSAEAFVVFKPGDQMWM